MEQLSSHSSKTCNKHKKHTPHHQSSPNPRIVDGQLVLLQVLRRPQRAHEDHAVAEHGPLQQASLGAAGVALALLQSHTARVAGQGPREDRKLPRRKGSYP